MNKKLNNFYSPTAECVHGFFKIAELLPLLPQANQKKIARFAQGSGGLSFREFIRLAADAINRPESDCIVLQIIFSELTSTFNICRFEKFHTIAWNSPQKTWRNLLKQHLTSMLAFAAFRATAGSIHIKTNSTFLPKSPLWFIPRDGSSCVGKALLWWLRTTGLRWSNFCDLIQDSVKERTLKSWLSGTIPKKSSLIKIHDTNLGLGPSEAELKRSFLVVMTIACSVSRLLEGIHIALGSQTLTDFIHEFSETYAHLLRTTYRRCLPKLIETERLGSMEAREAISRIITDDIEMALKFDPIVKKVVHGQNIGNDIDLSAFEAISNQYNQALHNLPPAASNIENATKHIDALKAASAWGKFKDFAIPFLQGLRFVARKDIEAANRYFQKAFFEGRFQACFLTEGILETALSASCYEFSQRAGNNEPREGLWGEICTMISWADWHGLCHGLRDVADDDGSENKHTLTDKEYQRRIVELGRRFFEQRFKEWLPRENDILQVSPQFAIRYESLDDQRPYKGHINTLNRKDIRDNSKLMNAIYHHDHAKAFELINDGANLNFRNTTEDNAFYYAMDQDNWPYKLAVAEAILQRNENPIEAQTLETPSRRLRTTAIRLVLTNRNPGLLKQLLARGIRVNKRLPSEYNAISPLYFAILACAHDIEDRPTIKCLDESYGSDNDAESSVEILITAGADVNEMHRGGMTPLVQAVVLNLTSVATRLVKAGASCDTILDDGTFIFELCRSWTMEGILKQGILNGQSSMLI
nr:hypothetical protein [uncultured Pseudodesulfovibrio sp.]